MFNAWGNTPVEGKLQILLLIFALEFATESKKPHYMRVRRLPALCAPRQHVETGVRCLGV